MDTYMCFICTTKTFSSVANPLFSLFAAKEEEKQKLMKWSSELKLEREQLELRVKQLSNSITVRRQSRHHPAELTLGSLQGWANCL